MRRASACLFFCLALMSASITLAYLKFSKILSNSELISGESVKFLGHFPDIIPKEVSDYQFIDSPPRRTGNAVIKDPRDPRCAALRLPTVRANVSIIIMFDGDRPGLLHTLRRVRETSPLSLLTEIIVIDNGYHLGFDWQSSRHPRVKLLANVEKQGVARCYMRAAEVARGDILVFMGSRSQPSEGWLEALLASIQENPRSIASAVADRIEPITEDYLQTSLLLWRGGFDWSLHPLLLPVPSRHINKGLRGGILALRNPSVAISTPVLAVGSVFAIGKDWLQMIGFFDQRLQILTMLKTDLSLRSWMCGGSVKIIPCSRVAVAGDWLLQEKIANRSTLGKNGSLFADGGFSHESQLLANSWLDNARRMYYATDVGQRAAGIATAAADATSIKAMQQSDSSIPADDDTSKDFSGLSSRLSTALQEAATCNGSFDWYIEHVYPQLRIMPLGLAVAVGQLKQGDHCMTLLDKGNNIWVNNQSTTVDAYLFVLSKCSGSLLATQEWTMEGNGMIRNSFVIASGATVKESGKLCLSSLYQLESGSAGRSSSSSELHALAAPCELSDFSQHSQEWLWRPVHGQLVHKASGLCLGTSVSPAWTPIPVSVSQASPGFVFLTVRPCASPPDGKMNEQAWSWSFVIDDRPSRRMSLKLMQKTVGPSDW